MSDQIIALTSENQQLKDQLQNNARGIENLLAQLDACKAMINESNSNCMILRTNNILINKQVKTLSEQVESLNKQLADANAKLATPTEAKAEAA